MIHGLILMFACSVSAAGSVDSDPQLTGIKCVVSGKAAASRYSCRYKKGRIYFDCNDSRRQFEANRKKFSIKANHQLVVTGQYLQTRCPIKQVKISDESSAQVLLAGVVLRFCCGNCRDSFDTGDHNSQKIEMVFGSKNFDRIFATAAQSMTAHRFQRANR